MLALAPAFAVVVVMLPVVGKAVKSTTPPVLRLIAPNARYNDAELKFPAVIDEDPGWIAVVAKDWSNVWPASTESVPPLRFRAAVGLVIAPAVFKAIVPPVIVVLPVYVQVPSSCSVPALILSSDPLPMIPPPMLNVLAALIPLSNVAVTPELIWKLRVDPKGSLAPLELLAA